MLAVNVYSSIAQLVEHMTVNHVVPGSSPGWGAKKKGFCKEAFYISKEYDYLNSGDYQSIF